MAVQWTLFSKILTFDYNLPARAGDELVIGLVYQQKSRESLIREYDAPETNNGIAEDLDWDEHYGVTAKVTYDRFSLHGHFSSRQKAIPTGAYEIDFNGSRANTLEQRGVVELRYDREIRAGKRLMLRSYLNHFDGLGEYPYDEIIWTEDSRGNWLGNELQYLWDTRPNNRLILGIEYQNHLRAKFREGDEVETFVDGSSTFDILSFYVQDEYQITNQLILTLGVRRDGYSTVGSSVTPRSALVYHASESSTFKLLYGEAFRAPSIYEATYKEEGSSKSNPDLRPETIKTLEAIWEQQLTGEILASAVLYNYTMEDLIDWATDPADELDHYQNTSKVDAQGAELGFTLRRKNGLYGYLNYDGLVKSPLWG